MADQHEQLSPRETIALWIVVFAGAGISAIAAIAIWAGSYASVDNQRLILTVFSTLVPMFGTWVGTVIAFYFSRENFATAARATRELVGQLGDDRLRQIAVKDAWIRVAAIDGVTVADSDEVTFKFSSIKAKLSNKVSRVPVWDQKKVVRFVIHESMIYKYYAEKLADPADPSLKDFLDFTSDNTAMRTIVSKIAWVPQTATLEAAKEAMTSVAGCQDVFATATGAKTEPVLGWITNADIANKAHA